MILGRFWRWWTSDAVGVKRLQRESREADARSLEGMGRPVVRVNQALAEGFIPLIGTGEAVHRETGERVKLEVTDLQTALREAGWHG